MKTLTVAIAMILVCWHGVAASQVVGRMELTSDAQGTSCVIDDSAPGVMSVHMFIRDAGDVLAVQFGAPKPACWVGATWLGDVIPWVVKVGDTQFNDPRGLSVAFGFCNPSPVYLGSIDYITSGLALPCCEYPIVKVPTDLYPEIEGPIMIVCPNSEEVIGFGAGAVINVDATCDCMQALPTETSTWGAIKEIYGD
jgi:hypothetical protein